MTELHACVKYTKARRSFLAKYCRGIYHSIDDELYNAVDLLYLMRHHLSSKDIRDLLEEIPLVRAVNDTDEMSSIVVVAHNYIDDILRKGKRSIVPDIVGLPEHFGTDIKTEMGVLPGQVMC